MCYLIFSVRLIIKILFHTQHPNHPRHTSLTSTNVLKLTRVYLDDHVIVHRYMQMTKILPMYLHNQGKVTVRNDTFYNIAQYTLYISFFMLPFLFSPLPRSYENISPSFLVFPHFLAVIWKVKIQEPQVEKERTKCKKNKKKKRGENTDIDPDPQNMHSRWVDSSCSCSGTRGVNVIKEDIIMELWLRQADTV